MNIQQATYIMRFLVIVLSSLILTETRKKYGGYVSDQKLKVKNYKQYVETIARQTMLQQFYTEQRVRTEGQSGLKLLRQRNSGTKNYFTQTHSGGSAAAVHDHSNHIRTVGLGEFIAVMNGVEFKTRHNDYRLVMPHRTSGEYHKTEPIPFPDVPPEVTSKKSVDEQIVEMKEWFKAFRDQDFTVRDYRKYFKPTLCYLEGSWTKTDKKIDEPFSSDRHFDDAKTWMELHGKERFASYSGTRSIKAPFLPIKIMNINESIPEFAQWNYRILCHPLKRDLPLDRLRVVEDLSSRMMTGKDINRHVHSRGARFQLNSRNSSKFHDRPVFRSFLDEIMEEIPGKDNYQGFLHDNGIDTSAYNEDRTKKDVSRYHRWFITKKKDAMGKRVIHRGYSDDNMFAAMTTQPKVAGLIAKSCTRIKRNKECYYISQKWTYALPLEVIYLTPLSRWNPYELKYNGDAPKGSSVGRRGLRNGKCRPGKEYNGTDSTIYYNTPDVFYTGVNADRSNLYLRLNSVCVLDQNGIPRKTRASGVHVFLPSIKGVGVLRQRYPIFPVHGEGSSVWKELNALREIVMDMKKHQHMLWNYNTVEMKRSSNDTELRTSLSVSSNIRKHYHTISLSEYDVKHLKDGGEMYVTTTLKNGHRHEFQMQYNNTHQGYMYVTCDGETRCRDNHGPFMLETT